MPTHQTGMLIIRAWTEEGSAEPLRAHVRVTRDVANGIEHSLTLARPDDVIAAVDGWLLDVLAHEDLIVRLGEN